MVTLFKANLKEELVISHVFTLCEKYFQDLVAMKGSWGVSRVLFTTFLFLKYSNVWSPKR